MNGKYIVAFGLGAAVGSAASWYFFKTKYEQLAQEEIDSVKEVFSKKENKTVEESEQQDDDEEEDHKKKESLAREDPNITEYTSILVNEGYTNESVKNTIGSEIPYVISPQEFGENYDYEVITLNYYADGVLTDSEYDEPVEDIENVVGQESLTHFGEYEEDSVYVRNDRLRVDYEILLDERKYTDVLAAKPYKGGLHDEERAE